MDFILLAAAGIFQGSFGLGYKKYTPFSWTAFWGIYSILCIAVAYSVTVMLNGGADGIGEIFTWVLVLCGAVWGLSAICFSKAISKIGMSMVYGVSMGISTIVGSVMPMIINGDVLSGTALTTLVIGLAVCIAGITIITAAGVKRDGGMKKSGIGILLAVISGFGSGAMNIGFSASQSVGNNTLNYSSSAGAMAAMCWLPVLAGGCIIGVIWCIGEISVKRE